MQINSTQRPNQYAVAQTLELFLRALPYGHCPSLFFSLTAAAEMDNHLAESGSSSCLCRDTAAQQQGFLPLTEGSRQA
jgi:hypothetical protein